MTIILPRPYSFETETVRAEWAKWGNINDFSGNGSTGRAIETAENAQT
jgi:hypothetical protein